MQRGEPLAAAHMQLMERGDVASELSIHLSKLGEGERRQLLGRLACIYASSDALVQSACGLGDGAYALQEVAQDHALRRAMSSSGGSLSSSSGGGSLGSSSGSGSGGCPFKHEHVATNRVGPTRSHALHMCCMREPCSPWPRGRWKLWVCTQCGVRCSADAALVTQLY